MSQIGSDSRVVNYVQTVEARFFFLSLVFLDVWSCYARVQGNSNSTRMSVHEGQQMWLRVCDSAALCTVVHKKTSVMYQLRMLESGYDN